MFTENITGVDVRNVTLRLSCLAYVSQFSVICGIIGVISS